MVASSGCTWRIMKLPHDTGPMTPKIGFSRELGSKSPDENCLNIFSVLLGDGSGELIRSLNYFVKGGICGRV